MRETLLWHLITQLLIFMSIFSNQTISPSLSEGGLAERFQYEMVVNSDSIFFSLSKKDYINQYCKFKITNKHKKRVDFLNKIFTAAILVLLVNKKQAKNLLRRGKISCFYFELFFLKCPIKLKIKTKFKNKFY